MKSSEETGVTPLGTGAMAVVLSHLPRVLSGNREIVVQGEKVGEVSVANVGHVATLSYSSAESTVHCIDLTRIPVGPGSNQVQPSILVPERPDEPLRVVLDKGLQTWNNIAEASSSASSQFRLVLERNLSSFESNGVTRAKTPSLLPSSSGQPKSITQTASAGSAASAAVSVRETEISMPPPALTRDEARTSMPCHSGLGALGALGALDLDSRPTDGNLKVSVADAAQETRAGRGAERKGISTWRETVSLKLGMLRKRNGPEK